MHNSKGRPIMSHQNDTWHKALRFAPDDTGVDPETLAIEVADIEGLGIAQGETDIIVRFADARHYEEMVYVPYQGEILCEELQHFFFVPIETVEDMRFPVADQLSQERPKQIAVARHVPRLILSGGQSGSDLGALVGAARAGITTGGVAPKGYRTEKGPQPDVLKGFGLTEDDSSSYGPRTEKNAASSDATIIFSVNPRSGGTIKTIKSCLAAAKPFLVVNPEGQCRGDIDAFLAEHRPDILNIAGNRETVAPGITRRVANIVAELFGPEVTPQRGVAGDGFGL